MVTEIAKMQALPKNSWEAMAMRRHPELLELRERILPLSGESSYSRYLSLFLDYSNAQESVTIKD
jgi:hypothetical protein